MLVANLFTLVVVLGFVCDAAGHNISDVPLVLPGLTLPPPRALVPQWPVADEAELREKRTVVATGGENILFCL
jgi:hypothetical protein